MDDADLTPADTLVAAPGVAAVDTDEGGETLVDDELLIEEISIDGMCGVY